MNILANNFYTYKTPSFGTSCRAYLNPIKGLQTGREVFTTTFLLRDDLDFNNVVDYIKENSGNKSKIKITCLAGADGSEAYSYGLCLLNKLAPEELKKVAPILSIDRDEEIIKAGESGRINLSPRDINISKEISNGKEYFVNPQNSIKIADNPIKGEQYKSYEPIPELKKMVKFKQGNLVEYIKNYKDDEDTLSVINCRNVMPYLHPAQISDIAYYADKNLKRGSLFIIGNFDAHNTEIENYLNFYNFGCIAPNVYKKY